MTNDLLEHTDQTEPVTPKLHMGIAEQGRVHALEGDHDKALAYYRIAIDMTVNARDPEIFFRHYLESLLESLELLGSFGSILEYCDKAVDLLDGPARDDTSVARELMKIYLRRGAVSLKAGDRNAARVALKTARQMADDLRASLPLADTLLGWIDRGYQIDPVRIVSEQRRTLYFTIRKDTVDPARAIRLPDHQLNRIPGAAGPR